MADVTERVTKRIRNPYLESHKKGYVERVTDVVVASVTVVLVAVRYAYGRSKKFFSVPYIYQRTNNVT